MGVFITVFADAGRGVDYGQLSILAGALFRMLAEDFLIDTISWSWHKSKCPVRAVKHVEILAASEGIDKGKVLRELATTWYGIAVEIVLVIDSDDFPLHFSTMEPCRSIFAPWTTLFFSNIGQAVLTKYNGYLGLLTLPTWVPKLTVVWGNLFV